MATRNLVPRDNDQGSLGISSKRWSAVHAANVDVSTLKVVNLQNANGDLLITKGLGIADVALDSSNQLKIGLDSTFLTSLGFSTTTGLKPDFAANGTVLAGDSFVAAINKLDQAVSNVADPTSLDTTNFMCANIYYSGIHFSSGEYYTNTSMVIYKCPNSCYWGLAFDVMDYLRSPSNLNFEYDIYHVPAGT